MNVTCIFLGFHRVQRHHVACGQLPRQTVRRGQGLRGNPAARFPHHEDPPEEAKKTAATSSMPNLWCRACSETCKTGLVIYDMNIVIAVAPPPPSFTHPQYHPEKIVSCQRLSCQGKGHQVAQNTQSQKWAI